MDEKSDEVKVEPSKESTQEKEPDQKEETLGDVFKDAKPEVKKAAETVPLSKYMDTKNALKEAQDAIKALTQNSNKSVTPADIASIAEKYNTDPDILTDLASVLESRARESVKQEIAPQLKEIEDERNAKRFDTQFEKLWKGAMDIAPEFLDSANKDVIKQLALLPHNQSLTLTQLLEQTYGQVVNKGRKTIEGSKSGGRTPEVPNLGNPSSEEWQTIKENPELLKAYNENLLKTIRF